uniref:ERI1 exoribonuclease 2 n=1 Tax=Denticeps clupeoides TaxID=299321 RepID=A0AAY4B7L5_9TELE
VCGNLCRRELGFVRRRRSEQFFHYLIVIDFESTCWKEKNSYGQEIIEFPAVLVDTSTGRVESEFHAYVQPQEHPVLSEFCTELTGITQSQVEAGVPLPICLARFGRWVQSLQRERGVVFVKDGRVADLTGHPCAFVTWSDWDLGVCLLYECKRKQICKPEALNSWIDLRATYKMFYNRKPKGLNGALQDLGIEFSGREHSGLDDARNTARLAWRMMTDGCFLKITKTLDRVSGDVGLFSREGAFLSDSEPNLSTQVPLRAKTPNLLRCDEDRNQTPGEIDRVSTVKNLYNGKQQPLRPVTLPPCSSSLNCQSLVSPQTVLGALRTVLCGISPGGAGTVQEPLTSSPPTCSNTSLVLVSTTVNSILEPETLETRLVSVKPIASASFKKPRPLSSSGGLVPGPSSTKRLSPSSSSSTLKITSPLCDCGRRAKRLTVGNGGPNNGRVFFSCPVRKPGCGFFKWESAHLNFPRIQSGLYAGHARLPVQDSPLISGPFFVMISVYIYILNV